MSNHEKAYFDEVAKHLCGDFSAIQSIERFTKNTDVIGAYAEAHVTSFVRKFLQPIRISTGTIISPTKFEKEELMQIDLIAWDPNPLPAIMDKGGFAMVPRNSVIGCLEIKRTDYPKGLDHIETCVLSLDQPNSDGFLGVVCVRQYSAPNGDNKLTRLIKKGKAVYLLDYKDEKTEVNTKGVYAFVNFLGALRKFHNNWGSEFKVNPPE